MISEEVGAAASLSPMPRAQRYADSDIAAAIQAPGGGGCRHQPHARAYASWGRQRRSDQSGDRRNRDRAGVGHESSRTIAGDPGTRLQASFRRSIEWLVAAWARSDLNLPPKLLKLQLFTLIG